MDGVEGVILMGMGGAGVSGLPLRVDASGRLVYTDTANAERIISGGEDNAGTAGTGTTAVEEGDSHNHLTILTVAGTLPDIAGTVAEAEGLLIYTLPAGVILLEWVHASIGLTQTDGNINADQPEFGIGSVIATGAVSNLSTPSTFEDYLIGTAVANCTGTAIVLSTESTAGGAARLLVGGSRLIHINYADTWAASGDTGALIAGTVTIAWRFLSA